MSKLGKKPITIPKDTKIKVETGKLTFTGPKGSRELSINEWEKNYFSPLRWDKFERPE